MKATNISVGDRRTSPSISLIRPVPGACEAKELGFPIDCLNVAAMTASVAALKTNGCNMGAACKTNAACAKDFLVVVTHHAHCLHDQVPRALEEALHDFEEFCTPCHIERQFDAKLPVCEPTTCSDTAGLMSAISFLKDAANNCSGSCAGQCSAPFKRLRAAHDRCEEDDVPRDAESLLHALEDACSAADCNVASKTFTPECKEEATTVKSTIGTSTTTSGAAALPLAVAVIVALGSLL